MIKDLNLHSATTINIRLVFFSSLFYAGKQRGCRRSDAMHLYGNTRQLSLIGGAVGMFVLAGFANWSVGGPYSLTGCSVPGYCQSQQLGTRAGSPHPGAANPFHPNSAFFFCFYFLFLLPPLLSLYWFMHQREQHRVRSVRKCSRRSTLWMWRQKHLRGEKVTERSRIAGISFSFPHQTPEDSPFSVSVLISVNAPFAQDCLDFILTFKLSFLHHFKPMRNNWDLFFPPLSLSLLELWNTS